MLNSVQIIGNIGQIKDLRYTASGKAVIDITVAVNEKFGKDNQRTTWFDVICWDKLAELVQKYCAKGSKVYIQARYELQVWEGKDGKKNYSPKFHADKVIFLDSKKNDSSDVPPEDSPY